MSRLSITSSFLLFLLLTLFLPASTSFAGVITVCQCNIFDGGKWTEQDQSVITYDTARRFCEWVAAVNPPGSTYPPIAVIGMQELMSENDRITIENYLEQFTGVQWTSARTPQGVNNTSGIGMFWRPDLVEYLPEWYLGEKVVEQIDNGYVIKFVGRLFRKAGTNEAFGFITGKLVWGGAILNGRQVTEEDRRQQAVRLKNWISNGDAGSPGMSGFPGTVRVIAADLNTDTGTATWNEMNLEYSDPGSQHTHNSFNGTTWMDLFGKRLDYIWWDRDAFSKQPGGFAAEPLRSSHFGSDHRAVYATIDLHPVDLTPPVVVITSPESGAELSSTTHISANVTDASGIMQVQFFIDDVLIQTDTTAPYEFDWNPLSWPTGYHVITAIATDASSNRLKAKSSPVVVWVGPDGSSPTIADAKSRLNGELVSVAGPVVTGSFGSYFYIEEPDRSSGIKVSIMSGSAPAVGSVVGVTGSINLLNGEREISATSVKSYGTAPVPKPVGLSNISLGGGSLNAATPGIYGGIGLNNIGLLVTCWGKVTQVVQSSGVYSYVYIDDGSSIRDGAGSYKGIRVDVRGLTGWTPPAAGKYIIVTGISSTAVINGQVQRRIKVRSASDIRAIN